MATLLSPAPTLTLTPATRRGRGGSHHAQGPPQSQAPIEARQLPNPNISLESPPRDAHAHALDAALAALAAAALVSHCDMHLCSLAPRAVRPMLGSRALVLI